MTKRKTPTPKADPVASAAPQDAPETEAPAETEALTPEDMDSMEAPSPQRPEVPNTEMAVAVEEALSKASPPETSFCPRCYRPESAFEECPNQDFRGHDCPVPVKVDPEKHSVVSCGPCGFQRVVPVGDLVRGTAQDQLPRCHLDACAARLVA